jgi:hypothetical protein
VLLVRREQVDDAVDRLGGVGGMQGRQHQVARLRRLQRRADGLGVAHLADEDHVGVLAGHRPQRRGEVGGVHTDLALVDDRQLVGVQDLDRILDGDDVAAPRGIDVADHRGRRGRLSRPGGAGDQYQPTVLLGQLANSRWHVQVVEALRAGQDTA